jgi:hypothetical protein
MARVDETVRVMVVVSYYHELVSGFKYNRRHRRRVRQTPDMNVDHFRLSAPT